MVRTDGDSGNHPKALHFQRRVIKLLLGVHFNASRSGLGFPAGSLGAHFGIDARGRRYNVGRFAKERP
jgi:hypothetical protein